MKLNFLDFEDLQNKIKIKDDESKSHIKQVQEMCDTSVK